MSGNDFVRANSTVCKPWRQEREAVRRAYCLTQPYRHRLLPNDVIFQAISRVSGSRIHRHGTSPCAVYRLPD